MENITIESLQYRNIVRKFFFRQNPPKPLTKEEFIENYGEAYENEYYTYLYSFLSQYVADLDQRVDKEISEGAINDSYLAEIEKELEKNKDSGIYSNKNNDIKRDSEDNDSVFQRKAKRNSESNHNDLNETTKDSSDDCSIFQDMTGKESKSKDSSIVEGEYESKKFSPLKNVKVENHEKEKKGFFRKAVEKVKAKISKPASKNGVRKNLIDGFSISAAAALGVSIFGCYTLGLKVITSAISMKVGVIAGIASLVTGMLASSGLWIAHTYHQAKRTGTSLDEFDDFDEEEENEKGGFLQELKNKFSNSKEEEYEETIDNEDEFDDTASKVMDDINDKRNDSSSVFKVLRKNDGRKPHFDSAREENHEPLQVGDALLERVDGEVITDIRLDRFDGIDEEIQATREPVKVKIK